MLALKRVIGHLDRALVAGLRALVVVLAASTFALISYAVFSRFVLNTSIGWAEEASRFMFVWMALLGWALVVRERSYALVALYTLRGRAGQVVGWILNEGLTLAVSAYLLSAGIRFAAMTRNVSPALGLDLRFVYAAVALSAGATILIALIQTAERLNIVRLDGGEARPSLS